MLCPLCRARVEPGHTVCPACGVDFLKWLQLQGLKAEGRPAARRERPWLLGGAVAALALAAALAGRPPEPARAPAPPAELRAAAEPRPAEPLAEVLRAAEAEGAVRGVEVPAAELEARFRRGREVLGAGVVAAVADELGLAAPRTMPLGAGEEARHAKCLKGGSWSYGSLPPVPEAGVECWSLVDEAPRRWVRQFWLPRRRAWAAYPEGDVDRACRAYAARTYSEADADAARAASFRAMSEPGADARAALTAYYGFLAEKAGAESALAGL